MLFSRTSSSSFGHHRLGTVDIERDIDSLIDMYINICIYVWKQHLCIPRIGLHVCAHTLVYTHVHSCSSHFSRHMHSMRCIFMKVHLKTCGQIEVKRSVLRRLSKVDSCRWRHVFSSRRLVGSGLRRLPRCVEVVEGLGDRGAFVCLGSRLLMLYHSIYIYMYICIYIYIFKMVYTCICI